MHSAEAHHNHSCELLSEFRGVTLASAVVGHSSTPVAAHTIASMADDSDNDSDDDGLLPNELYPDFNVRCALFEGVTNATELVSAVREGRHDRRPRSDRRGPRRSVRVLRQAATNCARRAENKAAGRDYAVKSHDLPRGRTTGADLVRALAPSTSMGGAFRDVGASDATTRLLVCAVSSSVEEFRELVGRVDGRRVPLSRLMRAVGRRA